MKKILITIMLLFSMAFLSRADQQDTTSIGFSGSYGNFNALGGEVYLKKQIRIFRRPFELKGGVNYRPYQFNLDGVEDMEAQSVGVFADLVYYPFGSTGLFTGIRMEGINMSWISEPSLVRHEQATGSSISSVNSGACAFLQLGYQLRLNNVLRLRAYGQPGIQQFQVALRPGSTYSYQAPESHYRFIYNVNLGLEFRLR